MKYSQTITIQNPSVVTYLSLEEAYGDDLTCPCTNIAIEHREFISLSPTIHQLCSSDFISDRWLNYLRGASAGYISADFEHTGSFLFNILASSCRLAKQIIADALSIFYSTRYISSKVVHPDALEQEIEKVSNVYLNTISKTYAQSFELIRDMIISMHYCPVCQPLFSFQIPHISHRSQCLVSFQNTKTMANVRVN